MLDTIVVAKKNMKHAIDSRADGLMGWSAKTGSIAVRENPLQDVRGQGRAAC
jgi:hypothetical protein